MAKRCLGVLFLVLVALGAPAADGSGLLPVEAAAPAGGYVVVQRAAGLVQAQTVDGKPPTPADQGFETLAVPAGKTAAQYADELRAQPGVLSAEPDAQVQAANIPNDPYYLPEQSSYLAPIGAPAAWDLTTGSKQVVVAVLDSGIDLNHPDFAGRLWQNPADAYSDGIDHDHNGCINDRYGCRFVSLNQANKAQCGYTSSTPTGQVSDDDIGGSRGHGTFVSGIIGAAGDNNIGVTGVAWNVQLMTVKVLDCGSGPLQIPTGYISDVAQGIVYATQMGANIINLSLAIDATAPNADVPVMRSAIQYAQAQGVIIVAAAGNHTPGSSDVGVGYPGAYTEFPNLVTVGASDNLHGNTYADYSNYGPAITLAAPGNSITSTIRSDIGQPNPYGTSNSEGGTSYATPLVTGMFALMMSRNSRLSYQDYIAIAKAAATPATGGPPNWAGAGVINIGAAVARVPMTVTGSALHDWITDVPLGTEVRAQVGSVVCGLTTTFAVGTLERYSLRIKSAAEQTGCGMPGSTVDIYIGGIAAQPELTWGGINTDLGLPNQDFTTVSPPPGPVVVQSLNSDWSNIAFLDGPGSGDAALASLPTPWTAAYHWDPLKLSFNGMLGAFQRVVRGGPDYADDWNPIQTYDAFWVDGPAVNLASVNPNPPTGRVVYLQKGWNNFTYTGTSSKVSDALAQIAGNYTQVLQYDNPTETWLSNIPGQPRRLQGFGGLFTFKVYWIYMTAPGSITMK